MLKRFDKKGQEGWTLVNLLIALFVMTVVVIGIIYFVQKGRDVGGNVPGKVEIIKQACSGVAKEEFKESYCNQIREIGDDKYVTCDYAFDKEKVDIEEGVNMNIVCEAQKDTQNKRILDEITKRKFGDNVLINGKEVKLWKLAEKPTENNNSPQALPQTS